MKPQTKRKLQLLIAILIFALAAALSYFSVAGEGGSSSVDVYLLIDTSGSMLDWHEGVQKIEAAKNAAVEFLYIIKDANESIMVGLISYNTNVQVLHHLTFNYNDVISTIQSLGAGGSTAMGDAIVEGVNELRHLGRTDSVWAEVLLTDGVQTCGSWQPVAAADNALQNHVVVHSIAYGGDADIATLTAISQKTGGKSFFAPSPQELVYVYRQIAQYLISPILHYGSRILMLIAIPLILFLPEIEKGAVTVFKTISTTILKRPTEIKGVRCPECGRLNRSESKFCGSCRTPLTALVRPCPKCGHINRIGARYCGRCRANLKELGES